MSNQDSEPLVAAAWARFVTEHAINQVSWQIRSVSNDCRRTISQKADPSLFCASVFTMFVLAERLGVKRAEGRSHGA